jgi:LacI family transcriptional regulator
MTGAAQRRPTMRDVAERAGVSFKTVSRVVNDEAGVSPELVARVAEAIDELGYRPDDRARQLRQGGSTRVIGFALVDVANPFFSSILRGIEEVARRHGYLVLSGSTDGDADREHQLIEAFLDRRVDGLLVVSSDPSGGPIFGEIARGTPVVFLDLEPEPTTFDLVRSDHEGGAVRATEHLIAHGHTDIAFLGDDPHIFSAGCRLRGYQRAMAAAGLTVRDDRAICGHYSVDRWYEIVLDLLRSDDPPTALFTAQNFVTIGGVQALHELGLYREIALVGFDEVEMAAAVEPGITVVPQHPLQLGRRAAELLFDRLGGLTGPAQRDVVASDLIARGSGEIPPRRRP